MICQLLVTKIIYSTSKQIYKDEYVSKMYVLIQVGSYTTLNQHTYEIEYENTISLESEIVNDFKRKAENCHSSRLKLSLYSVRKIYKQNISMVFP